MPPTAPPADWPTIDIAGHACDLHAPADARGRAVILLHGLQGRRGAAEETLRHRLVAAGLPVLAPDGGRSWWLDRIVPAFDARLSGERHVVEAVVAEATRRFDARPPLIAVLGVGMGGQAALRLAYRHPAVFPIAAGLAPALDFHVAMREAGERADGELFDTLWELFGDVERARQETAILHVHPLNWPRHQFFASDPRDHEWHDGAARLHGKLVALGIPHTALLERRGPESEAPAGTAFAADAVRFLQTALDAESRRVPG